MRLIPIGALRSCGWWGCFGSARHQNKLPAIAERLQLAHRQQQLLSRSLELQSWLQSLNPETTDRWKASEWTFALEKRGAKAEPITVIDALGAKSPSTPHTPLAALAFALALDRIPSDRQRAHQSGSIRWPSWATDSKS